MWGTRLGWRLRVQDRAFPTSFPSMLQLVTSEGDFCAEATLSEYLRSAYKDSLSTEPLRLVSIIGPQSSGKSTLLNALFGSNFATLNPMAPPVQTTRGIQMCAVKGHTIVLDSQGSDSIEAGDAGKTFDRRTATFVMALSGAVIVNCNFKDIGRHEGSQLSLLRQIFAVQHELMSGADALDEFESIDLSSCSSPAAPSELAPRRKRTLLLFVIRDYPTGDAAPPLEPIGAMLQEHIVEAWMSANRQNTTGCNRIVADLAAQFKLHVCHLPNPHADPISFHQAVNALRRRHFDPQVRRSSVERSSSDAWAQSVSHPRELVTYSRELWRLILASRQLDAPSFRESLAHKWCDIARREVEEDCLKRMTRVWSSFNRSDPSSHAPHLVGAFSELADALATCVRDALCYFDEQTRRYDGAIAGEHRGMLLSSIQGSLEPKLTRLSCEALDARFNSDSLPLRPKPVVKAMKRALPPVVGSLEAPGLALALCPLSVTVGSEEEIVAMEVASVMSLFETFHAGYCQAVPKSDAIPAKETLEGGSLLTAAHLEGMKAGVNAEWTLVERDDSGSADGRIMTSKHQASHTGSLLRDEYRDALVKQLEGRCRDHVRMALKRQQRLHAFEVTCYREGAAGLAMLGGGIACVGGFWVLGPTVAAMGGIAGGSTKAVTMLGKAANWLCRQRLPIALDTTL